LRLRSLNKNFRTFTRKSLLQNSLSENIENDFKLDMNLREAKNETRIIWFETK
jgi:hypothetical protein